MTTYTDHQQRQMDARSGQDLDRRAGRLMTQERMGEIIDQATKEIGKDAELIASQKRRIEDLERAVSCMVSTWDDPGPMGTMYEMPRAVSYAKGLLEKGRC